MKTGQKFDVSLEALKLSDLTKEQLPMWYHLGTGQQQQPPPPPPPLHSLLVALLFWCWPPIASLVHGLNIIIIYYHNQKCSARMWQPVLLEQSSLTPHPYHQPQIFLSCISHVTFHLSISKSHPTTTFDTFQQFHYSYRC